ncbi:aldo/keto reductase [Rhodovibrio salinarum]|uniref:Aldo/keto reductase n=1 Tax=Rhodovibrio salinarum TaxID=1087 RepID=A0A934QGX6_9PROT|nr:aldo/keto reductase [Rhodovibrio salinarum]MBK1696315.1 aldo/keto reductase [Rhodovibrio salinarum]
MSQLRRGCTRRQFLATTAAAALAPTFGPELARAASQGIHTRAIPSSGERIPAVGMGTWITFNVGGSTQLREHRKRILAEFFAHGGGMIDSSPMYGSSEDVVGWCLDRLGKPDGLISATKVWTRGMRDGVQQMARSRALWGLDSFDVMQVHNLVDWQTHLKTLRAHKDEGKVRYIGVTTSHGSRHDELERIMRNEPLDFVQFTYNILDRWAEDRLLPLARERGIAVIVNRPYKRKQLFQQYQDQPLPGWAEAEAGAQNWAEFFLKFIISHPAVTCAIPATSQIPHMRENMGALSGPLPEQKTREKMARYVAGL